MGGWEDGYGSIAFRGPLALINFSIRASVSPTLPSTQRVLSYHAESKIPPLRRCCSLNIAMSFVVVSAEAITLPLTPPNCPIFRQRCLAKKRPKK